MSSTLSTTIATELLQRGERPATALAVALAITSGSTINLTDREYEAYLSHYSADVGLVPA
jgi:hypothetical protein